jgi:glycosyltransferase involved in cell wall biosynthesis
MRAGTVVIASPVGAYQELVEDGVNGFLIQGDHRSEDVYDRAASLILSLAENPTSLAYVQRNAQSIIWDSDTMAKVWSSHWGYLGQYSDSSDQRSMGNRFEACDHCKGKALLLEDGYHCIDCGVYSPVPYGSLIKI